MMVKNNAERASKRWSIIAGAAVIVVGGALAFGVIVPWTGDDPAERLTAIQAATGVTGGIAAIVTTTVLAWRAWLQSQALQLQRQAQELQSQALDLQREAHELQVQKSLHDRATTLAQQVTELIKNAVEQLSADKPTSQLVGLRELDRLGRDHPEQRETIAEVWCNFLRTPASDLSEQQHVRAIAQQLLLGHLRDPVADPRVRLGPPRSADYWQLHRIDLRGAVLVDADFSECLLPKHFDARLATFRGATRFAKARFTGVATFTSARFEGAVDFKETLFTSECNLDSVSITGAANFTNAIFRGPIECRYATFTGTVLFQAAQFEAPARFWRSTFTNTADFNKAHWYFEVGFTSATFENFVGFRDAKFLRRAVFGQATFGGPATFELAQFGHSATFTRVTFCDSATFTDAYFDQDTAFDDSQFGAIARFRDTRFEGQMTCRGAYFDGMTSFAGASFKDRADFALITLGAEATIDLADATAAVGTFEPSDRVWPRGWTTIDDVTTLRLVRIPDPAADCPQRA